MPITNKPKKASRSARHPIIETIGTVPIREVNYISIYINAINMKKIATIILKAEGKISAAKVLALSGKPCQCCKPNKIMIAIGDKIIFIPRGLLSSNREDNRSCITTKKRKYK